MSILKKIKKKIIPKRKPQRKRPIKLSKHKKQSLTNNSKGFKIDGWTVGKIKRFKKWKHQKPSEKTLFTVVIKKGKKAISYSDVNVKSFSKFKSNIVKDAEKGRFD